MLSINISELIWSIINFFLLYFLLKRFLFGPLVSFMDERKARISQGQALEREVLESVNAEKSSSEQELEKARAEAARIITGASAADEAEQKLRLSEAKKRAEDKKRLAEDTLREQFSRSGEKLIEKKDAYARSLADAMISKYGK